MPPRISTEFLKTFFQRIFAFVYHIKPVV